MKKYLYNLNYPVQDEDLCFMEMRYLFSDKPHDKCILSDIDVDPTRSPFIKERIKVIYEEDTFDNLIEKINMDGLCYDDFKVIYVKLQRKEIEFEERLKSISKIGTSIIGKADIHNPKIILALTNHNGKWIFGEYEKNDCLWHKHDGKPHSYSNALSLRMARSVVNIAVGNELDLKLVDPCCGVGTVLLEALSMGIDIKGCEINKQIARNAKENLKYFGYENIVTTGDMHDIKDMYEVAIIDIPYGVFTPITEGEQQEILNMAAKICKKLILISFENMDEELDKAGFNVIDKSINSKGGFMRMINVCILK